MCPAYVAGLIGLGDRKSVQPMAARDGSVSYDQLHHFVGSGKWNAVPLEADLGKPHPAATIGEKSIVADAVDTVGQDCAEGSGE